MAKMPKKQAASRARVDRDTLYSPSDAVNLLKEVMYANFDEAIEVHARLGIDPRQADQAVRTTVALPHGTGKSVRVLVFAEGEAERAAREAGADFVGSDDLIKQINDGWVDFDAAIATAEMMGKVGGLGRVLGRRGLMPNPRSGTVVRNVEDLPGVIKDLKGGRVEFRNDRLGIVHTVIGRKSFSAEQILENFLTFVDALNRAKPSGVKGIYLKNLAITSTMAPGIRVNVAEALASASEAAS
ncbi:MAG: 50S ribosomal protein L1 [Thermomicrobiales bacterium]|nr:50S ribosomal protein L1 [Thermomicrobiales bacterium]